MTVTYNQAGYVGCSRSTRAAAAESEGKLPLTRLCKAYGYVASKVRLYVEPCEWHHVSRYANAVDYYDPADALRCRRQITVRRPSAEQLAARQAAMPAAIERARDIPKCYVNYPKDR